MLKLGVHPVVQDDFPPDYRTVREMLRSKVESCDAVLCLIGQSYGFEPVQRDDDQPRRSYTQMEYDLATELKKPVFLFVATDKCPLDNPLSEDESLRQLQQAYVDEVCNSFFF